MIIRDLENMTYKDQLRELGLFTLEKSMLGGDLIAICSCLMGGCREVRGRVFLELHSSKKRGNRHKLEHEKFSLDIRKNACHVSGQTLAQISQRCCGISILGDSQNSTGKDPEQPSVTVPVLTERLD